MLCDRSILRTTAYICCLSVCACAGVVLDFFRSEYARAYPGPFVARIALCEMIFFGTFAVFIFSFLSTEKPATWPMRSDLVFILATGSLTGSQLWTLAWLLEIWRRLKMLGALGRNASFHCKIVIWVLTAIGAVTCHFGARSGQMGCEIDPAGHSNLKFHFLTGWYGYSILGAAMLVQVVILVRIAWRLSCSRRNLEEVADAPLISSLHRRYAFCWYLLYPLAFITCWMTGLVLAKLQHVWRTTRFSNALCFYAFAAEGLLVSVCRLIERRFSWQPPPETTLPSSGVAIVDHLNCQGKRVLLEGWGEFLDREARMDRIELSEDLQQYAGEVQSTEKLQYINILNPWACRALRKHWGVQLSSLTEELKRGFKLRLGDGRSGAFHFGCAGVHVKIEYLQDAAQQLEDLLPSYCRHMKAHRGSLLCHIYGAFLIQLEDGSAATVLLTRSGGTKAFDVKGCEGARDEREFENLVQGHSVHEEHRVSETGLAALLSEQTLEDLRRDFDFLDQMNRTDYSLLVARNGEGKTMVHACVIDFLQDFNILRAGEHVVKKASCCRHRAPAVLPPSEYSKRLLAFMQGLQCLWEQQPA